MPLKILLLSHFFYPSVGGIEVNSEILAQEFYLAGNEVRVVTWSDDPSERLFAYKVIRRPSNIELIKIHAWADVVFENNPCLRLAWPNIIFRKPSIVALNTLIQNESGLVGIREKFKFYWLRRANKVIAVSNAVRISCWPDAIVIGNPYRKDQFKVLPSISKIRDFVFLGRLVSEKGAELAVRAIHKLIVSDRNSSYDNPMLTIVGEGTEKDRLERLVDELELQNNIHFTGLLHGEELTICLNKHRYILVPSLCEEAFGNVVLEGMACGCIPIVADTGGLPDAVGKAGITFHRGSVDSLVAAIKAVILNKCVEDSLRDNISEHLKTHHPNTVANMYSNVINSTVEK